MTTQARKGRRRLSFNSYTIHGDVAHIELQNSKGEVAIALIDAEDLPRLAQHNRHWRAMVPTTSRTQYAVHSRPTTYLHRFILNNPEMQVDHINGNGLDCRKANLRLATPSQNRQNSQRSTRNTSGLKGARRHAASGKWTSGITVEGKTISLGYFATKEEAAAAYAAAAREHFGEFARTDVPSGDTE